MVVASVCWSTHLRCGLESQHGSILLTAFETSLVSWHITDYMFSCNTQSTCVTEVKYKWLLSVSDEIQEPAKHPASTSRGGAAESKSHFNLIFSNEYQYQAIPGLIRLFIINQFVTASHRKQSEVVLELYVDLRASRVNCRTLLPGNFKPHALCYKQPLVCYSEAK